MAFTFKTWCEHKNQNLLPGEPWSKHFDQQENNFLRYLAWLETCEYWYNARSFLYEPFPKQLEFLSSPAPVVAFYGGNQAGKSLAITAGKIFPYLTGYYPPWHPPNKRFPMPTRGRLVVESFAYAAEENMLDKMEDWLPYFRHPEYWEISKKGRNTECKFKYLPTGSTLEIITWLGPEYSAEGWVGNYVVFDEPPPRSLYTGMKRGVMSLEGELCFAMTPWGSNEVWVYNEIYKKSNLGSNPTKQYYVVEIGLRDNLWHNKKFCDDYEESIPEEEVSARIYGKSMHLKGLVLPHFNEKPEIYFISPFKIPAHWPRFMGLDPHRGKGFWCLWMAVAPNGQRFYYDEYKSEQELDFVLEEIKRREEKGEFGRGVLPRYRLADKWVFDEDKTDDGRSLHHKILEVQSTLVFQPWLVKPGSVPAGRIRLLSLLPPRMIKQFDKKTGKLLPDAPEINQPLIQVFSTNVQQKDALLSHTFHQIRGKSRDSKGHSIKEGEKYKDFIDIMRGFENSGLVVYRGRTEKPKILHMPRAKRYGRAGIGRRGTMNPGGWRS